MAEWGGFRGQAGLWPPGVPVRRWRPILWPWSNLAHAAAGQVRDWAIAEAAPGRLMPWLPVAFGLGVAVYFAAEREPELWATICLAMASGIAVVLLRARTIAFASAFAVAAASAGFAAATLKTTFIAHPVLHHVASNVEITGFIASREERERSDRIVLNVVKIEGGRLNEAPERVRLSVRKGTAPAVGNYVTLKARLSPPLAPLRPGGYDFARDLYFQRIGASGYVLGSIKIAEPPAPPGFRLQANAAIQGLRDAIDRRIREVVSGDAGSIASALITGKRDAISKPVNDAMYVSSLAHVLSISGYHMAVVAGVVFFVVRALLALVPGFANRRPIKKWAALAALLAAAFYLLLSGAEVATQRAFIMAAIVLIGVMVDRAALTLRNLALAAFAVLLVVPEAVVHPSFQMSFAATLALVAAYERSLTWMVAGADTSFGARVALWGGREIFALVLASLVAGLATAPYAAFHFHRIAPYGVLANLLAMPIVSIWVMPIGLLGLVASPFGFDGPFWRSMGDGIDWMIAVAMWVVQLPGAVGRISAFGVGALLLGTLGLVVLCLLKTPLRWCGAMVGILACIWAARNPIPDVLISADAQSIAVRRSDGRLTIMRFASDGFAVREWLAADGDERAPNDKGLRDGFQCDASGCIARLADGGLVALSRSPAALEEDCRQAVLVVSPRQAPPGCPAKVVDRALVRARGAVALRRTGNGWDVEVARQAGTDRPWARAATPIAAEPLPSRRGQGIQRDATPRREDLEPGD
jgi:competence protein ComEC